MNLTGKNKGLIVITAAALAVTAWQFFFILTMPDGDTDAYAHFIIARDIVRNPYDLGLHWVWLPLFHYIDALFVLTGAGMQAVRLMNVLVWAAIPFILYFYLLGKSGSVRISLISGLIAASFPLGILMGTTAQPEPLFTLSLLLFIVFFDRKNYFLSSLFITAACMMRYEAWAALGFTAVYSFYGFIRKREEFKLSFGLLLNFLIPAFFFVSWVLLRYRSDGEWFQFLHGTMKFAGDALGETPSDGGFLRIARDLFFYVFWVPFIFTGVIALSVPFGIRKFISQNKAMFVSGLGVLVFITLSWVTKSNLGLNRHFTSLIPIYAAAGGYGIETLIEYAIKYGVNLNASEFLKRVFTARTVSAMFILIISIYAVIWLHEYRVNNNKFFEGRFRAAEYLKANGSGATIICNDPMIEVFSGIDYRCFDHFFMSDSAETNSYIASLLKTNPVIIAVKVSEKPFIGNIGSESVIEIPMWQGSRGAIRIYRLAAGKERYIVR